MELQNSINQLKNDLESLPNKDDIINQLDLINSEMSLITYEPQYQSVIQDRGANAVKKTFKYLGAAGDILLMLAPLPTGKLKPLLKTIPMGEKALKTIKTYNKFVSKKDKMIKKVVKPVPMLGKFLNALSIEYWAEKAGEKIGNYVLPDNIIQIEDAEVKKQYFDSIKPYQDQVHSLNIQLSSLSTKDSNLKSRIEESLKNDTSIEKEIENLKKSKIEEERFLLERLLELKLAKQKGKIIESISYLILNRNGDGWNAELRNTTIEIFLTLKDKALKEFNIKINDKENKLIMMLEELKKSYNKDKSLVDIDINNLKLRSNILFNLYSKLESL